MTKKSDTPRVKTSKWSGLTNYECSECSFAHLDKEVVERHVAERHPAPAETSPAPTE
jgi:hypothetical protein